MALNVTENEDGRSPLTGTKKTKQSSKTSQRKTSSTSSATTQKKLNESLKTLTTSSEKKSKSTSTAKAKAKSTKTTTKSTTSTSKQQQKKPSVKRTTRQKVKDPGIKVINSRKLELFPHVETFPYYLDDQSEKKKCWFTCEEHARKYIERYHPKYKLYCYTGAGR